MIDEGNNMVTGCEGSPEYDEGIEVGDTWVDIKEYQAVEVVAIDIARGEITIRPATSMVVYKEDFKNRFMKA